MSIQSTEYLVNTNCGNISVWDSGRNGPAVLMIHGNSACKEVFLKQFESSQFQNFRLIAIDLPGHGKSQPAKDPKSTYSLPGYAAIAIEVLKKIGVQKATVVGWSLGGHVAIDMLRQWKGIEGILITGTPPIPLTSEGFGKGFLPTCKCLHLLSQKHFTKAEAETFVTQGGFKPDETSFLLEATLKADGEARACLISSMQNGVGGNQKEIVEASNKPIAIVHGAQDTGINLNYIQDEVKPGNFWGKKVHVLNGGHGVFWENADEFNKTLSTFLNDIKARETVLAEAREMRYLVTGVVGLLAIAGLALSFLRSHKK